MDTWGIGTGRELEMIWSKIFRWENRGLGSGSDLSKCIAGDWRSWDHCEISQHLVPHPLYCFGTSSSATCCLAHPKYLRRVLFNPLRITERGTDLSADARDLAGLTLCRNNVVVLPLQRAGMSHLQEQPSWYLSLTILGAEESPAHQILIFRRQGCCSGESPFSGQSSQSPLFGPQIVH